MSWSIDWHGKACDSLPEQLPVRGVPGNMAKIARDAIWEALQAIATRNPTAHARVIANGWETPGEALQGQFTLSVVITDDTSGIRERIDTQQPVDLIPSHQGAISSPIGEPASPSAT